MSQARRLGFTIITAKSSILAGLIVEISTFLGLGDNNIIVNRKQIDHLLIDFQDFSVLILLVWYFKTHCSIILSTLDQWIDQMGKKLLKIKKTSRQMFLIGVYSSRKLREPQEWIEEVIK